MWWQGCTPIRLRGGFRTLPQPLPDYSSTVGSWYSTPPQEFSTVDDNEENCTAWLYSNYDPPFTVEHYATSVLTPADTSLHQCRPGTRFLSTPATCPPRNQQTFNYSCEFAATSAATQLNFTSSPVLSASGYYPIANDSSMEIPDGSAAGGVSRPCRPRRRTKRQPYSKDAISQLSAWYDVNRHHPYANRSTTEQLAASTKLTYNQVRKWLANTRAVNKGKLNTHWAKKQCRLCGIVKFGVREGKRFSRYRV